MDGWAGGWAELAYVEGITTGVGEYRFNPRGLMSEKQYIAFLLRALEYDSGEAWDNAVLYGYKSGLTVSGNSLQKSRLTKREAADYMYRSLSSTLQVANRTLLNVLIDQGLVSAVEA